jgi:hypothetical protein
MRLTNHGSYIVTGSRTGARAIRDLRLRVVLISFAFWQLGHAFFKLSTPIRRLHEASRPQCLVSRRTFRRWHRPRSESVLRA